MNTLSSSIRIGLVIGQLSQGGAERQTFLLAKELAKQGVVPIVYCLSTHIDPYGAELTEAGITWHAPPDGLRAKFFKLFWLIRRAQIDKCDLLYGFLHVGNVYAGAASFFLRLPYIASIRSANSAFSLVIKSLSRIFLKRADVIVGNSDSTIRVLKHDLRVTHERVQIIRNIVEPVATSLEARRQLRQKWGVTTEPVVGTIALIKRAKRPWLFVNICDAINATLPTHFVWVGDGPERKTLEEQTASLDKQIQSRVHLEGFQTDIAAYLSAFDFFILTSAFEGSPNALLEAMSAKQVCVAVRVAGITDVFAEHSPEYPLGILCDQDDPDAIAEAIAETWHNPALMEQIGEHAAKMVQDQYSSEHVIAAYSELFEQLLYRS